MKRPNPPSLVTIAIFTTITIIFWIFFSVYQILTSDPEVDVPQDLLIPLNPVLDQQTLDKIEQGLYFEEGEVSQLEVNITETEPEIESNATSESTPTPTASPPTPAEPDDNNTATDSANIEIP